MSPLRRAPLSRVLTAPPLLVGLLLIAVFATSPAPVRGQLQVEGRAGSIEIGGRLHAQLRTTSVDGEPSNEFFIRRARLNFAVSVNDFIDGRIQPEFEGGELDLKDAYVRLTFSPGARLSMGQFKRAFDLFELESSTQLAVIERDGRIPGLDTCDGVGGACSYSRFTEELAYSERDTGVRLDGSRGPVEYEVTVTNGEGGNESEVNDGKSLGGRIVWSHSDRVAFGANVGIHDYTPDGDDEEDSEYATAFALDAEIGDYGGGLHLQAAVVTGDNWLLLDSGGDPVTFSALQVLGSYYHDLDRSDRFEGIEPVFRLSWGDPDRDGDDDSAILWTPGVNLYIMGRNRIGANIDVYSPSMGDTEWSFKLQSSLYF